MNTDKLTDQVVGIREAIAVLQGEVEYLNEKVERILTKFESDDSLCRRHTADILTLKHDHRWHNKIHSLIAAVAGATLAILAEKYIL